MIMRTGFWQILVIPWTPKNACRFAFYASLVILLALAFIWSVEYIQKKDIRTVSFWWLLLPVFLTFFILSTSLIYSLLMGSIIKKLPKDTALMSHCRVVYGIFEMPGIAFIAHGHLFLKPILGNRIEVPLNDISSITKSHLYNGCLYLGKTLFFKLKVPTSICNKWRLGFGVEDGEQWLEHFNFS